MLRDSCKDCVLKHVGQAAVLLMETKKGYAFHFAYAIGHLADAEDESSAVYPIIAKRIREFRIKLLTNEEVSLDEFIEWIYNWWKR